VLVAEPPVGETGAGDEATLDGDAHTADSGVVAPGLLVERLVVLEVVLAEIGVGGIGLACAAAGVEPQQLQIGEGRAELVLGYGARRFHLAQHGQQLGEQPALLAVGAQQQTDVLGMGEVGAVAHVRLGHWFEVEERGSISFGFGGAGGVL
jgi:hypothetical protein